MEEQTLQGWLPEKPEKKKWPKDGGRLWKMPKKNPFKPCPFCNHTWIELLPQDFGYIIRCNTCNAYKRSFSRFFKQAYAAWNWRHQSNEG